MEKRKKPSIIVDDGEKPLELAREKPVVFSAECCFYWRNLCFSSPDPDSAIPQDIRDVLNWWKKEKNRYDPSVKEEFWRKWRSFLRVEVRDDYGKYGSILPSDKCFPAHKMEMESICCSMKEGEFPVLRVCAWVSVYFKKELSDEIMDEYNNHENFWSDIGHIRMESEVDSGWWTEETHGLFQGNGGSLESLWRLRKGGFFWRDF